MKTLLKATLLLIALAGAAPALAETLPPPRIATIDLEQLSQQSLVTHDLDRKVQAAKAAYRRDNQYRYESLQDELKSLRLESANLDPAEREQRQKALEDRVAQAGDDDKRGLDAIDARGQAAMASLQPKLAAIVKRVADGMSLDLVIDRKAYDGLVAEKLAAPGAKDLTPLVLTFLNAEVPTVDLPAEGAPKP
jgi:Skp family chaperone for outer membrane proteins